MKFETYSPEETKKIGFEIAQKAHSGDIYCLDGDLGVGKTVFTKGFAEGLGITDYVTSPTFTIINEYSGKFKLYHFDLYRISSPEEMDDTGYEEYFYGNGICLIEWASLVEEVIPKNAVKIKIEKDLSISDDYRIITIDER